jgi:hypothetical protein
MTAQEDFIIKSTILKCLKMAIVQTSMLLVQAYSTANSNAYIIGIESQRYFLCKHNVFIKILELV